MAFVKHSDYTKKELESLIIKALNQEKEDLQPIFYAVGGSRVTGFTDEESDIDIHGFHLADGKQYMQLKTPKSQLSIKTKTPLRASRITTM